MYNTTGVIPVHCISYVMHQHEEKEEIKIMQKICLFVLNFYTSKTIL